jgi:hypothetical protein
MKRALVLLLLLPGCASSAQTSPDGRPIDAAGPIDAPVDGAVAQGFRPGAELVVAGGRVRAGTRAIEVEIGHAIDQGEITAGTRRLRGAAVVVP